MSRAQRALSRLLPFPPDPKASPDPHELLWLYDSVRRLKPKRILEGGAGCSSAILRKAAPDAFIMSIDDAELGSTWAKNMDALRGLGVEIRPLYPRPGEVPLFDLFVLDSSAGVLGLGADKHLRGQALLSGLLLCRRNAWVIYHDNRGRITKDVRAFLTGSSTQIEEFRRMTVCHLHLRWDTETGSNRRLA